MAHWRTIGGLLLAIGLGPLALAQDVPVPPEKPWRSDGARVAPAPAPAVATAKTRSKTQPNALRPARIVCRDPRLEGRPRGDIKGHLQGCGIVSAVEVTRIAGIALSQPATLQCGTAKVFADWITGVVNPAAKQILARRVTRIHLMSSYSCRPVNGRPGANLSRHSFGLAVDVAGVTLGDGTRISVLKGWGKGHGGQFLRRIWQQACGLFKTVIGPEGDKYHNDHFHLDLAKRRTTYCK